MRKLLGLLLPVAVMMSQAHAEEPGSSPEAVFQQRIMPILNSPNPSSCVQCHLASVDLKDYIRPSCEETFVSLRSQGLVDIDSPRDSKILRLIDMGADDRDPKVVRIHAKMRALEFEAFATWLTACCTDKKFLSMKYGEGSVVAAPAVTDTVIRHSRKDRLLDSFVRNVWSQRMRCFPCHTPGELDPANPAHKVPAERHRKFVEEYGQRMNLFRDSPLETMNAILQSSSRKHTNSLPLVNIEKPAESLLVLKPTAKLPPRGEDKKMGKPSSTLPVSHMGGLKMHVDDFSYKAMIAWIEDYANIAHGTYEEESDLPKDNWFPTKLVVRVMETPEDWKKLSVIQLFVYSWDSQSERFADHPVAFTQTKITPAGRAIGTLFRLASPELSSSLDPTGETLPPGRYQIRAYLDTDEEIRSDPSRLLNDRAPDGTAVVEANWQEGFKNALVVHGSDLNGDNE